MPPPPMKQNKETKPEETKPVTATAKAKAKAKQNFPNYEEELALKKAEPTGLNQLLGNFLKANEKGVTIGRALLAWESILKEVFCDFPEQAKHLARVSESYALESDRLIIHTSSAEASAELLAQKTSILKFFNKRFPGLVINKLILRYRNSDSSHATGEASSKNKIELQNLETSNYAQPPQSRHSQYIKKKHMAKNFLDDLYPESTIRSAYLDVSEEGGEPFHLYD